MTWWWSPQPSFAPPVKLSGASSDLVPILARVAWSSVVSAFITGEEFDSARALTIGLVSHVSNDPHETAQGLVTSICAAGPEAVATTVQILRRAANDARNELDEVRQLGHMFASAEAQGSLLFGKSDHRHSDCWANTDGSRCPIIAPARSDGQQFFKVDWCLIPQVMEQEHKSFGGHIPRRTGGENRRYHQANSRSDDARFEPGKCIYRPVPRVSCKWSPRRYLG